MTVTVIPIIEPHTNPAPPLVKVMNERLQRLAKELEEIHLKELNALEPLFEDVVIYISYNSKYSVRWKIVNDVPLNVENIVSEECGKLGYIRWKFSPYVISQRKDDWS